VSTRTTPDYPVQPTSDPIAVVASAALEAAVDLVAIYSRQVADRADRVELGIALAHAHAAFAQAAATLLHRQAVVDLEAMLLGDRPDSVRRDVGLLGMLEQTLEAVAAVNNEHSPWGVAVVDVAKGLERIDRTLDRIAGNMQVSS
jgi:site-specific recombinase